MTNALNRLELVDRFRSIPIFSTLNDELLLEIISNVHQTHLPAGNMLFHQGDHAEYFYLLEAGQIQLFLESIDGHAKIIDVVNPGQMFAEAVCFFDNQSYPVNAQAIQDSVLLAINLNNFRNILKGSIDACFHLMASMCKRLHVQLIEINNLSLHNATYRLVYHLLKSVPDDSPSDTHVVLHYPKSVLASRLSIKPETLSRILAQLKHKNIIDVKKHEIILHDINALRNCLSEETCL
ncbi:MAG: Crp/Fnr family transcriptional regulator [Thiotrichales bacterium]|nr:Crp/Fnr family transcriptional regulator [Thiotrichales bacterium]